MSKPLTPPHSDRSERAVLGSMLVDSRMIEQAQELLVVTDFYKLRHQYIFTAICGLHKRGMPVDLITLEAALVDAGQLDQFGGTQYITDLFDVLPTAANLRFYAARVKDKAIRRRFLDAALAIAQQAADTEVETADLAELADKSLLAIGRSMAARPYFKLNTVVSEAYESITAMHDRKLDMIGVPSGLKTLDDLLSGFQDSDLIILAARPSVGKTALALNFAMNAAIPDKGAVLIFSLEMGRVQLALRLISRESGVNLKELRAGKFRDASWDNITAACSLLSRQQIVIDDAMDVSLREMRAKARRVQVESGLRMIIVDYLQLMEVKGKERRENRQADIAAISRGLKQLAREFNVPLIALSQLSRKLEERADKRPVLSDLRESGAIEQDADVVAFLHRDDRYSGSREKVGKAEIIVAKQRNGPLGTAHVGCALATGAFSDLAPATKDGDDR